MQSTPCIPLNTSVFEKEGYGMVCSVSFWFYFSEPAEGSAYPEK